MQATLRTRWPRRTPARPRKRASSPGRTGSARGRCTPRSHRCRRPCAPPGQADSARRTLCPTPRPPAASARGRTRRVPPAPRGAARLVERGAQLDFVERGAQLDFVARESHPQPIPRKVRHQAVEAAGQPGPTCGPARNPGILEASEGSSGRKARLGHRGRAEIEGEGSLRSHEHHGSRGHEPLGEEQDRRDPHAAAEEQAAGALRGRREAIADRPQHAQAIAPPAPRKEAGPRPDLLEQKLEPPLGRLRPHDRHRPSHRERCGPQRRCTNAPGSARAATAGERILRTCCPAAWWSFASTSASSRKIVPRCARLTRESRETPPRPRGSG